MIFGLKSLMKAVIFNLTTREMMIWEQWIRWKLVSRNLDPEVLRQAEEGRIIPILAQAETIKELNWYSDILFLSLGQDTEVTYQVRNTVLELYAIL